MAILGKKKINERAKIFYFGNEKLLIWIRPSRIGWTFIQTFELLICILIAREKIIINALTIKSKFKKERCNWLWRRWRIN